jgi:hypothetical protein
MTQVSAIVRDALLLLGVQDATESVSAQEMQDGIRELNKLLARWEADGVSLGWTSVSAPTDALPAPMEAEGAIAANLALYLQPRYKVPLDANVVQQANDGLAALRADVVANSFARLSYDDLPAGTRRRGGLAGFIAGA